MRSQSANSGAEIRNKENVPTLDPEVSRLVKQLQEMSTVEPPPTSNYRKPTMWDRETDTQDLEQYISQDIPTVALPPDFTPEQYAIMRESCMDERSIDASFRTARENSIARPTKELNAYIDLVKKYPEFKDQIMNNLISEFVKNNQNVTKKDIDDFKNEIKYIINPKELQSYTFKQFKIKNPKPIDMFSLIPKKIVYI